MMQADLWTAFEAAAATEGMLCARGEARDDMPYPEESWSARGLSIDTRSIRPGEMFIALKDQRDGHDFVDSAFRAGASAALVSRVPDGLPDNVPLLLVPDTLRGLEAMAAAARDRCFGRLIAVTGSAGKTSTKEMLRAMLSGGARVHAADRSFNNHLGVPLTLAQLPMHTEYGVFEIGMNHAGEITPLTKLVRPHVAIITTVAAAHLEFFNSVEEIAMAKAEIFSGLRPGGVAVLPLDNAHFGLLRREAEKTGVARIVTFGTGAEAEYRLLSCTEDEAGRTLLQVSLAGKEMDIVSGIGGEHQALNALAALAAVDAAGADRAVALSGLAAMAPVDGRGAVFALTIDGKTLRLIDESYNANPASMAAALKQFGQMRGAGRKIAVLGEMRELGTDSAALHLALADEIKRAGIDLVFGAGDMLRDLTDRLPKEQLGGWAETGEKLEQNLMSQLQDGDAVLVKGSNASGIHRLATALRERAEQEGH